MSGRRGELSAPRDWARLVAAVPWLSAVPADVAGALDLTEFVVPSGDLAVRRGQLEAGLGAHVMTYRPRPPSPAAAQAAGRPAAAQSAGADSSSQAAGGHVPAQAAGRQAAPHAAREFAAREFAVRERAAARAAGELVAAQAAAAHAGVRAAGEHAGGTLRLCRLLRPAPLDAAGLAVLREAERAYPQVVLCAYASPLPWAGGPGPSR